MLNADDDRLINGDRRLRISDYGVPEEVRLEEGRLFWQPVKRWRQVQPRVETFDQFLTLVEAPDDRKILRFAKRWGVLWLCKDHLEPVSDPGHRDCWAVEGLRGDQHWLRMAMAIRGVEEDYFTPQGEPVAEYRRWSRIVGALLGISQQLDDGELGKSKDWQTLQEDRWDDLEAGQHKGKGAMASEKKLIAQYVNRLLEIGDVRPRLSWDESLGSVPSLNLTGATGLFGTLAVALLEQIGEHVITACSGCRKFYYPKPRPRSGQDRYCKECSKKGVPVARAKHRQSLRDKLEREQDKKVGKRGKSWQDNTKRKRRVRLERDN